jgi:hypothetical protein
VKDEEINPLPDDVIGLGVARLSLRRCGFAACGAGSGGYW